MKRGRFVALGAAVVLLFAMVSAPGAAGQRTDLPVQEALRLKMGASPTEPVEVIVQTRGPVDQVISMATRLGGQVTRRWSVIDGFAMKIPAGRLPALANQPGVKWISLNHPMVAAAKGSGGGDGGTTSPTPIVNSSNLASAYPYALRAVNTWNAGYTGKGVTVAVLDSGVAYESGGGQLDLNGRVVRNVTVNSLASNTSDKYGHGSHVAGIIAGNGATLGGKYIGVAPGAQIFNIKFSTDDGTGVVADLLSAMDLAYQNRSAIRVVNISATTGVAQSYKVDPVSAAAEKLWNSGVVVVVAAGNRGAAADAMYYPPANDPYVITVGAVDDKGTSDPADDAQTTWSSRGKTQEGIAKPDVLAPGARIVSLLACNSCGLAVSSPDNIVDQYYFRTGGTSMAAPMVSGAVALMLERNPSLTPNQVKWILMNTARKWSGAARTDAKIVDAYAAVMYSSTPGTANQGLTPSAGGTADGTTSGTVSWLTVSWLTSVNY